MRIQIGDINLLSLEDWNSYNLFYILISVLICLYCLYYISIELVSDSKNNKPRFGLKLQPNITSNEITQYTAEHTRDFFSQLHSLSMQYYTNEIIGLNIFNVSGKMEYYITSTSRSSLEAISEALSKDKNLKIECGDIFNWSDLKLLKNFDTCYRSQVKLQKKEYPIKSDSLSFATGLLETIADTPNSGISLTLLPYNHQSKFEIKIRKLLQQKQNDKGMTYVPEQSKTIAKQLEEKNKHSLFLTKIEIFGTNSQSNKQISSRFSALSTNLNRFYSSGSVQYKKGIVENKIHSEYWFSWLMPKPHFYLNSAELACLWLPVNLENKTGDLSADIKPYKLN